MSSGVRGNVRATPALSYTIYNLNLILFDDTGKIRGGPGVNMGGNGNPPKSLIGHFVPSI